MAQKYAYHYNSSTAGLSTLRQSRYKKICRPKRSGRQIAFCFGERSYPSVTSTVTFVPAAAMGRTLPEICFPSTVTAATPFWTPLGLRT